MSGWLGAMNYGVIVANDVDAQLMNDGKSQEQRVKSRQSKTSKPSTLDPMPHTLLTH